MNNPKGPVLVVVLIIVIAAIGGFAVYEFGLKSKVESERLPTKIGVLLPLTGSNAYSSDEVLNWAKDSINSEGGVGGRKIELVYKDTNNKDVVELAQEFIDDRSILVVIGPDTSSDVMKLAPMFIANKKILISPTSTAADVFIAFGGKSYVWRACQSDVAQIRTILHILKARGVGRISLMYEDSVYGKTFYDWTGFFSLEMGIELLNIVQFQGGQSGYADEVNAAINGEPEYIICTAFSADAVNIKKEFDKTPGNTKLFFTDAAGSQYLIDELGESAEGLEGTSPSTDPDTDFEDRYRIDLGRPPNNFAATTFDAFLLALYVQARQEYTGGTEQLHESLNKIVSGRGNQVSWDKNGMKSAVGQILKGELPDISGASGPLEFDARFGMDPVETYYSNWRVENGSFRSILTMSSSESLLEGTAEEGASACMTFGSEEHGKLKDTTATNGGNLKPRSDLWAVVIATSRDWDNYRHQADALAIYNLLRDNGLTDDRIILFLIDDIPNHEKNTEKGDVHHYAGGANLRPDAEIDYSGKDVTAKTFRNVLIGQQSSKTPIVLGSDENSNVFVYIVDHGGQGVIPFDNGGTLMADAFKNTIENMYSNNKFRQMFVIIETCFSESMVLDIDTPEAVFLTSASSDEPSFACNYDSNVSAWLADDCTYSIINIMEQNNDITIGELYNRTYKSITGSHVRLINYNNFSNVSTTKVSEFITP